MNKHIFIFSLLLGISLSFYAQAGIKFDISHTTNKVVDTVSSWQEQAEKLIKESTTIQTLVAYGKGVQEMIKFVQEQKAMITDTINQTTGAVTSIKDTATSTVSDLSREVSGTVGDVTGAASGSVNDVAGGAISAASSAASKTQSAQQLLSLKSEKTSLESEYNTAAEARKTEYEGKVKSYQENNATYQEMIANDPSQKEALEAKISANNEAIAQLQTEYEAKEQQEKATYEAQVSTIDAKIQEVQAAAAQESMSLAQDGFNAAKSLFGNNNNSAEELNKTIANNFVPEKEQLTSANIKKVEDYRNKTKNQDVIEAYAVALQKRADRGDNNEDADETATDVTKMEGSSAAIAMDTQLKVKNMQALLDYTTVLIAELKMKTATDLANMNVGKLNNPNKDVTEFNLDDYKYKKPSKFSKENLTNLAKDAKEGLSTIKDVSQTELPW